MGILEEIDLSFQKIIFKMCLINFLFRQPALFSTSFSNWIHQGQIRGHLIARAQPHRHIEQKQRFKIPTEHGKNDAKRSSKFRRPRQPTRKLSRELPRSTRKKDLFIWPSTTMAMVRQATSNSSEKHEIKKPTKIPIRPEMGHYMRDEHSSSNASSHVRRMCDASTWNMYHRIMNARRRGATVSPSFRDQGWEPPKSRDLAGYNRLPPISNHNENALDQYEADTYEGEVFVLDLWYGHAKFPLVIQDGNGPFPAFAPAPECNRNYLPVQESNWVSTKQISRCKRTRLRPKTGRNDFYHFTYSI